MRLFCGLVWGVAVTSGCAREAPGTRATSLAVSATTVTPAEALDRLDTRTPVPLLPMMANHQKLNMRDHLVAVQEITSGLALDDFAAIERAAGRMGFSEQMGQMCTHMGAAAPGFTEQALNFHHTADTIAAAAAQRDRVAVTRALGTTLQLCTSCHATYRQAIVDEATWSRLTSNASPTEHSPH